jgi:ring-1,2-phenylacetyl-CoA epoxidase subunit PaaE
VTDAPVTDAPVTDAPVTDAPVTESALVTENTGRPRLRTDFHPLVVKRVEPLTDDSAAITFAVPGELARAFAFAPGQSLTIRRGDQRRSYSICSPAGAAPRIGVREVADGAVSGWLVHQVKPGDIVEAQVPSGTFTPDLTVAADHVLIAAGSGITPMMSIAASVLAANSASTVTLLYGNRRSGTVMFADEVADLKDAYPARMQIVHVLSREPQEVELHSGRLDRERLARLLPVTVSVADMDHWWLCGPLGLVTDAMDVLASLGVDVGRVHRELFWVGDDPPAEANHDDGPAGEGATVTVILDGRSSTFTLPAGTSVLDGAQQVRPDLPFACKGGVCGTCRARLTQGEAVMRRNYALEQHETDAGYILTCQALPRSDDITVDYDA